MSVIKDGIQHICRRLDDIRDLLHVMHQEQKTLNRLVEKTKDEAVVMNDLLEEQQEDLEELLTVPYRGTLEVKPVETTDGKTMFLVTGEQLSDLLMACRSATLQMKEREAHDDE